MSERLCLLTVHAHPDDEASKGAGTVARYHDQGVHTVLVCCTGGEEGDILNPAMDTPEVRGDIGAIRQRELDEAAEVIGYDEVVMLGYRDSGMPDSPANQDPSCFARAPLDEAVGRLVAALRAQRPQVVVTYDEEQSGYPHPDHLRVHEISMLAFDRAADAQWYPEAGQPWQVAKLYYVGFSGRRILAIHEKFVELGLESPFDAGWIERANSMDRTYTTLIDISQYTEVRRLALLAHATQVDPNSPFWFGLPPEVMSTVHPVDEYVLARTAPARDHGAPQPGDVEDDLFAGVRSAATR